MDDLLVGSFRQGRSGLTDDEQGEFQVEGAIACKVLLEIAPLVHTPEQMKWTPSMHATSCTWTMLAWDQGGGRLGLATEALHIGGVRSQILLEHLESHLTTERLLGRPDRLRPSHLGPAGG